MLPTILSDCLCSLQATNRRFAFVIDIILDANANITSVKYTNALIKVFKNFAYEEQSLLVDADYNFLLNTTKQMAKNPPSLTLKQALLNPAITLHPKKAHKTIALPRQLNPHRLAA